jgi:hypothetical protein
VITAEEPASGPGRSAVPVELGDVLPELRGRGLLPEPTRCVFACGSLVRGWGNPGSDLDLYVVGVEQWQGDDSGRVPVALPSATVLTHAIHVGDRRWELNYWTAAQVDGLIGKFAWELFDNGSLLAQPLSEAELKCAERLTYAVPVTGAGWLRERRERVDRSAFRAVTVTVALARSDDHIEDLAGQLEVGDIHSAVLSARFALGYAVDALLASRGHLGLEQKWRCRRFQDLTDLPISFEEYWALDTMRSYDPSQPGRWIDHVVALCRRISSQVQI